MSSENPSAFTDARMSRRTAARVLGGAGAAALAASRMQSLPAAAQDPKPFDRPFRVSTPPGEQPHEQSEPNPGQ